MVKKLICRECMKIVIEDFEKWLKENPETRYVQCPYCYGVAEIK